jgi:hypothetical protein
MARGEKGQLTLPAGKHTLPGVGNEPADEINPHARASPDRRPSPTSAVAGDAACAHQLLHTLSCTGATGFRDRQVQGIIRPVGTDCGRPAFSVYWVPSNPLGDYVQEAISGALPIQMRALNLRRSEQVGHEIQS